MTATIKALLYTSDPYEPKGVIGLFQNEQEKKKIQKEYLIYYKKYWPHLDAQQALNELIEITIPIGIFGEYH
jgi:hypothetical protein